MGSSDPAQIRIQVGGNVDGNIVVGDNNFVVNTNYGTIVNKQAPPQVRARDFIPQPPRAPRGFLNRAAELQTLEAWILSNEMVLIHGPDGMGKSSLLRQVANGMASRSMPNGVILLEGASSNDDVLGLDDLIQRIFDSLFESVPPLKVNSTTARTYLSNTRPLLLLDEVPLSPALQNSLPDLFPNGAIFFTSDVVVGRKDFLRMPVGPLQREVSIRLLVNRSGIALTEHNRATFNALCALLEDTSLAVVITGNVVRETGITLDDTLKYFQKISDSQKTGLDRAYVYAFDQLTPEEQNILSIAAITPGASMSLEWLVAAFGSEEAEQFIERIKALGLLTTNSPRLRVPPGIRVPAQRASLVDENTVLRRLADFLLAAVRAEPQNWDLFSDELGNLIGALTWAARTNQWRLVLQLGRVLDPYLTLRGLWDTWRDVLDYLLEAARQGRNKAAEAYVLHQAGVREMGVGTPQGALDYLYQALSIRQSLGDTIGMAYTQHNIDILIGPPPPPTNRQPDPQSPSPLTTGGILLLVGAAAVFGILGLLFLGVMGPLLFPPPTTLPIITNTQTSTLTATASSSATITPTLTVTDTQTMTPTEVLPVLDLNLRALSEPAFLYQGVDYDYFDVPVSVNIYNAGTVNISSLDYSIRYDGPDGSHLARFRYDGQNNYLTSAPVQGIFVGNTWETKAIVMIPSYYGGSTLQLTIETDGCQSDMQCHPVGSSVTLPIVVGDFINAAPERKWLGFDPNISRDGREYDLTFNGPEPDPSHGSVSLESGKILEDASQPFYVLATHPTWVSNGTIEGLYGPGFGSYYVQSGDLLIVRVGFITGGAGDGVTFHVNCFGDPNVSMVNLYDLNDGKLRDAIVAFRNSQNDCIYGFSLWVDEGNYADQGWPVWLSAYIARYPQGVLPPPTSTRAPIPTPRPTASPSLTPFPTALPSLTSFPTATSSGPIY